MNQNSLADQFAHGRVPIKHPALDIPVTYWMRFYEAILVSENAADPKHPQVDRYGLTACCDYCVTDGEIIHRFEVIQPTANELLQALRTYPFLIFSPSSSRNVKELTVEHLRQATTFEEALDALAEEISSRGQLPALFRYDEERGGQVIEWE
jgi:hypothetical protein